MKRDECKGVLRVLVVGLGSVGQRHARNLLEAGGDGIAVSAFSTGLGSASARERLGGPDGRGLAVRVFRTLDEALADPPDAVAVCNPTSLHVPVALAAARRGCHLFIEKPLSHTLDGVAELVELVASRELCAMVGFQFRFHPGLREARRLIEAGAVGRVIAVRAHWGEYLPGWHPEEDHRRGYSARRDLGGGVVLTLSHPFDYLRWLFGEVVEVVAVTSAGAFGFDVEDVADVSVRFASGVQGHIHLDYVQRPPAHWMEVTGTGGTLRWDGLAHSVQWFADDGGGWRTVLAPAGFERNTMFLDEMRHFLDCVRNSAVAPVVTLGDGVAALRIALAALESAAAGRTVVFDA